MEEVRVMLFVPLDPANRNRSPCRQRKHELSFMLSMVSLPPFRFSSGNFSIHRKLSFICVFNQLDSDGCQIHSGIIHKASSVSGPVLLLFQNDLWYLYKITFHCIFEGSPKTFTCICDSLLLIVQWEDCQFSN